MKQYAYRLIGYSGHYDQKSDNKDKLIQEASSRIGLFSLWHWSGKQWTKIETFLFSHYHPISLGRT